MSEIEVERCEIEKIDSGAIDSKKIFETNSDTVALEVLNDIVESALDSALTNEEEQLKAFRMVGDIIDPYTPRAAKITELYDVSNEKKKEKKLTSTEEEVKKLIGEIGSPSTKGTGDQLQEAEEIVTKKKSFSLTRNFSLEKKTRLTDLVKTSKSLIAKFLSSDNSSKATSNEWEEHNEEFIKSIELNQVISEKAATLPKEAIQASPTNLSNSDDIVKMPDETGMQNINLKDRNDKIVVGNTQEDLDYIQKSLTFPIASCSRIPSSAHEYEQSSKERKKWNLGWKLVNYIKKKTSRRDIDKTEV